MSKAGSVLVSVEARREAFAAQAMALSPFWVSNESPDVFPEIASRTDANTAAGRFLLAVNGAPVAWTEPHGAAIEWIADRATLPGGVKLQESRSRSR